MPKKTERGDPLGFFNIHSVAKQQKKHQKNFSKKKSRSAEKNERGESLVSPGMVCYAEKQEKPFWFSSLDQIVHFDATIFCRTFVELFWSVRVDRKKRVTIIVAFHFMKRRLKKLTAQFVSEPQLGSGGPTVVLTITQVVHTHVGAWIVLCGPIFEVAPVGWSGREAYTQKSKWSVQVH